MNIVIASDHAGFELKKFLMKNNPNIIFKDLGPYDISSVDYPDYAHRLAKEVSENTQSLGVLICGSGNGVCMAANKHPKIRAALCWSVEIASLAKQHNDANVLCIPARFIDIAMAQQIFSTFITQIFEGGRHQVRVNKI